MPILGVETPEEAEAEYPAYNPGNVITAANMVSKLPTKAQIRAIAKDAKLPVTKPEEWYDDSGFINS